MSDYRENSVSEQSVKPQRRRRGLTAKILAYTALLTAISAVCNIYTVYFGAGTSLAVSFTYIPNFFAGAFLGPLPGFICGLFGDLIGCWIAPKGDINPIILLASGLLGFIPGVVFKLFRKEGEVTHPLIASVISLVAVLAICTVLNTIGLYLFYFKGIGRTLEAVFVLRMPKQVLVWLVNAVIILAIRVPMRKLIKP